MSNVECVKSKAVFDVNKSMERKIHKLSKMMKPLMKFLTRKARTNIITPSTCNYYITETVQNDVNESKPFQLHFKFCEESADNDVNEATEIDENALNEALESRLQESIQQNNKENMGIEVIVNGEIVIEPVIPHTYFATPVHFIETIPGHFSWVPLPDSDIRCNGDKFPITESQLAEQQVPVVQEC